MFQDDIQINNELATHAVLAIHDRLQEHIKVRGQVSMLLCRLFL